MPAPNSRPPDLYDPRRSGFAGWSLYGGVGGDGGIGGAMATTTGGSAAIFTPGVPVDRVRVFFKQGENAQTTATAGVSADGGSALATLAGGATPGYIRSSAIALGTLGSHAIAVTPAGGAPFYLAGMIAWNSAVPSIDVADLGVSGVKAAWQATSQRLNWLWPDLTIVNIGSTDMLASAPTDVTAFAASVQAVVKRARASGDCVLVFPAIGRDAGSSAQAVLVRDPQRAPFRAAMQALALANGCAFVDEQALLGERDVAQAMGLFADSLHETGAATVMRAHNLATLLLA